jgi:hypothetical protein
MPCEIGVASLSAPRPASLGLLLILALGILVAGLWRVLAADRAAFGIPSAVSLPLARLWCDISPPSPGCSASWRRFLEAAAGADVAVTSPGAAGMGQDSPLASDPVRDLQAPVLATSAESIGGGAEEVTHVVTSGGFAP